MPTNKKFGFYFSLIFLIISIYFFGFVFTPLVALAIIFILFAILMPKLLYYPNKLWFNFGIILSKVVNPIICFIIYFGIIGLTKLFFILFNKNSLLKNKNDSYSYWINRNDDNYNNFNNQF